MSLANEHGVNMIQAALQVRLWIAIIQNISSRSTSLKIRIQHADMELKLALGVCAEDRGSVLMAVSKFLTGDPSLGVV